MRIGIVSDIHANYVALRTVLDSMGEIDALWCLGDLVGYGPQPNECVAAVSAVPHLCVPGNHDWGMLGRLDIEAFNSDARTVLEWTRKEMAPENLTYLEGLPMRVRALGSVFTFVHASPRDAMWDYLIDLFDAAECFSLFYSRYLFVGHTHVPLVFRDMAGTVKVAVPEPGEMIRINVRAYDHAATDEPGWSRMIINPGSVGQPRDRDPRAAYMVLEVPDPESVEPAVLVYERIEYPIEQTQGMMQSLGFPPRLISRLEYGL